MKEKRYAQRLSRNDGQLNLSEINWRITKCSIDKLKMEPTVNKMIIRAFLHRLVSSFSNDSTNAPVNEFHSQQLTEKLNPVSIKINWNQLNDHFRVTKVKIIETQVVFSYNESIHTQLYHHTFSLNFKIIYRTQIISIHTPKCLTW